MGVVIPILIFLLCLNTTYAYFTASTNKQGDFSTGIISVSFTDETSTKVKSDSVVKQTTIIQPGQSINITGGVKNDSEYDIYAIIYVEILVEGEAENIYSAYYTANGNLVDVVDGVSTTAATKITASQTVNFSVDYELDFFALGNNYMGKKIYTSYRALAIQFAGMANAVEATNLLISEIKILPSAYKQVEYVESTGTQYIDTGFKPNPTTTKISTVFQLTDNTTEAQGLFGARNLAGSIDASSCNLFYNVNKSNSLRLDWLTKVSTTVSVNTNQDYTVECVNNTATIDGNLYSSTNTKFNGYINNAIYIGNFNAGGNPYSTGAKAKFKTFKIWDGEILVRDFVPCYRKSDNVAGLYDLVNDIFYTNAGTGDFIVGADIN